ncbi:uncharacterized protein LKV04_004466 [Tautogolabrus adspersus]
MMMLWICLLIGSITCSPVNKVYRSDIAAPAGTRYIPLPFPASSWDSGRGESSDLGSSSSLPSLHNPSSVSSAGPGSYSGSLAVYRSPNMAEGNTGGYYAAEVYTSPERAHMGLYLLLEMRTGALDLLQTTVQVLESLSQCSV